MATLIVGCGYLGLRVGRRLVERGERVFGTTRSPANGETLADAGMEPIIVDVLDASTLSRLPEVDRALYCVGFDRTAGASLRTVYVDGLGATLDALAGKVGRVVYVGSTSVYGRNDGGWATEDTPPEPVAESGRVGLEAEGLLAGRGLETVVVRYSGLYGPGRIVRGDAIQRGEAIVGEPAQWLNLIQIDDAASAAVVALDRGAAGRVYLATDDRPILRREYYTRAAALLNAPAPRFVVPAPGRPEARRDEANKRVSNRRIKEELGLRLAFPDIETGLPDAIARAAADG